MQLSRRQIYAYAALAAVVIALGVRYVILPRPADAARGEELLLTPASPTAPGSASPTAAPDVLVYVCGAVRSPGVIRLPDGARVAEALDLAGGATAKAELGAVNLAAKVADGQQIVVPEQGAAPPATAPAAASSSTGSGSTTGAAAGGLVNLNTASLEELDTLQGVGPSTAQKIIDYRTTNGGFKTIDEIKDVPGIGDAKFAAIKAFITV